MFKKRECLEQKHLLLFSYDNVDLKEIFFLFSVLLFLDALAIIHFLFIRRKSRQSLGQNQLVVEILYQEMYGL